MAQAYKAYSEAEVELPGGNYTKWYWAARHMGSDFCMVCPARRSARLIAAAPQLRSAFSTSAAESSPRSTSAASSATATSSLQTTPAYLYLFSHAPDGPSGEPDGEKGPTLAHHSAELPFVFRVEEAYGPDANLFHYNTSRETPLADAMADAWVEFAATGAPPATWPPYSHDGEQTWMEFGRDNSLTAEVRHSLKRAACDLWDATQLVLDRGGASTSAVASEATKSASEATKSASEATKSASEATTAAGSGTSSSASVDQALSATVPVPGVVITDVPATLVTMVEAAAQADLRA